MKVLLSKHSVTKQPDQRIHVKDYKKYKNKRKLIYTQYWNNSI